jgi:hypothetical protein
MPTFASRVLGRSVGQANDKARQRACDQAEWPPFQNIDLRDEFAPALAGGRCPKEPASYLTRSRTKHEESLDVRNHKITS